MPACFEFLVQFLIRCAVSLLSHAVCFHLVLTELRLDQGQSLGLMGWGWGL